MVASHCREAHPGVDPEEGIDLRVGDAGALDSRGGEAGVLEEQHESGERGHHRQQAEIVRRQEPAEDEHRAELEEEL